tara:strand:- start:6 stop:605 length:600 start_codon:yes stop_codon:yes gene_type:complete
MRKFINLILVFIFFGAIAIIAEFIYNIPSHSFNAFRYYTLYGGGQKCLKKLQDQTDDFVALGTFERGNCRVKNAVRISSYKNTKISKDLILSCPTAVKVGKYFNELGAKNIEHMGTYNCRKIAKSKIMSEHSYGTAIDISKINGASVKHDWNKDSEKGKILFNAYEIACNYFSNIITPDTDRAHHDHFHFDNGYGKKCF